MKPGILLCAGLIVAAAGGCKKTEKAEDKKSDKPTKKQGSKDPVTKDPVTKDPVTKDPVTKDPVEKEATTGEKQAATYATCWGHFNDRKWDEFEACFDPKAVSQDVDGPKIDGVDRIMGTAKAFATAFPDAKGEIQMTLVGDNHVVGILLFTGTHDGPLAMKGGTPLPATHKKIGFLMGHVIDVDPKTNLAVGEYSFYDAGTLMGQLGIVPIPHREPMTEGIAEQGTVVTSGGSDVEKANLAALEAANALFNSHDLEAWAATRTDGFTFYDSATPTDVDKAQMIAGVTGMWKAFSDLKNNVGGAFAAGDYVVSFGQLTGTNDGDLEMGKIPATGKSVKLSWLTVGHYQDGKLDKAWRFVNGLSLPMQLGLMK